MFRFHMILRLFFFRHTSYVCDCAHAHAPVVLWRQTAATMMMTTRMMTATTSTTSNNNKNVVIVALVVQGACMCVCVPMPMAKQVLRHSSIKWINRKPMVHSHFYYRSKVVQHQHVRTHVCAYTITSQALPRCDAMLHAQYVVCIFFWLNKTKKIWQQLWVWHGGSPAG